MKNIHTLALVALAGLVSQAASAANPLTIADVTAAARAAEKNPNSLKSLAGKPIALEIGPRDNDPHFRSPLGDPGITVLCQPGAGIGAGKISGTVVSFELDVDSGREQINVLKLKNCEKAD